MQGHPIPQGPGSCPVAKPASKVSDRLLDTAGSDLVRHAPQPVRHDPKAVDIKGSTYSLHTNEAFLEKDESPAELGNIINDNEKVCLTTTTCCTCCDCVHRCMPACVLQCLSLWMHECCFRFGLVHLLVT